MPGTFAIRYDLGPVGVDSGDRVALYRPLRRALTGSAPNHLQAVDDVQNVYTTAVIDAGG